MSISRTGPWPATGEPLDAALAALEAGSPIKRVTEQLLLALADGPAERVMQILRESRGAWLPISSLSGGRALFLGNGLSGASVSLARSGFEVTICEPEAARVRFGQLRAAELSRSPVTGTVAGTAPRLPFEDGEFDLVVLELGLFGAHLPWGFGLEECRRVTRAEVVLIADNRLGYKRSGGQHGVFHVPGPFEWLREVLVPPNAEHTLAGYRARFGRAGLAARAFALYPHSGEFAYVVALDAAQPSLPVGPKERENRPKVIAKRLGLFSVLTPSFALAGSVSGTPRQTRLARVLGALADRTGEPMPEAEHMVATRGNSALVLTRGSSPGGPGSWCLHVPFSPAQRGQVEAHFRHLELLRERFPGVPAPEPLFAGQIEGLYVTCERRLAGLGAPQFTGDRAVAARMFREAAGHFSELVMEPPRAFTAEDFEHYVATKFALVGAFAEVPATLRALDELEQRVRATLVGNTFPLVFHHADLRSKHVQVEGPTGRVLGYLDWGSSETPGLPYFDLLHLIVHERKQEAQLSAGAAWRAVCEPGAALRDYEREALDLYADRLGLDAAFRAAIAEAYPVLVGAMAEANWDYSRPRWIHRQFGL